MHLICTCIPLINMCSWTRFIILDCRKVSCRRPSRLKESVVDGRKQRNRLWRRRRELIITIKPRFRPLQSKISFANHKDSHMFFPWRSRLLWTERLCSIVREKNIPITVNMMPGNILFHRPRRVAHRCASHHTMSSGLHNLSTVLKRYQ